MNNVIIYRLFIQLENNSIHYKDVAWNELVDKVKRVIKHPRIKKYWIRHASKDQLDPAKYILLQGTHAKPKTYMKWVN